MAVVSPGVNSQGELVPSHGASRRRLGDKKNWKANSGGGGLKPVHFSFSELWADILHPKRWAIYQIEAIIEKHYLV
jgi:hypothetical protein